MSGGWHCVICPDEDVLEVKWTNDDGELNIGVPDTRYLVSLCHAWSVGCGTVDISRENRAHKTISVLSWRHETNNFDATIRNSAPKEVQNENIFTMSPICSEDRASDARQSYVVLYWTLPHGMMIINFMRCRKSLFRSYNQRTQVFLVVTLFKLTTF